MALHCFIYAQCTHTHMVLASEQCNIHQFRNMVICHLIHFHFQIKLENFHVSIHIGSLLLLLFAGIFYLVYILCHSIICGRGIKRILRGESIEKIYRLTNICFRFCVSIGISPKKNDHLQNSFFWLISMDTARNFFFNQMDNQTEY